MNTTTTITDQHPTAKYIAIIDENGKLIPKVKSYDTVTKEAELYKTDENGEIVFEWNDANNPSILAKEGCGSGRHIVMEKRVLTGSSIVFKVMEEPVPGDQ